MKTTKQSKSTAISLTDVRVVARTYKVSWQEHLGAQGETDHHLLTIKIETGKAKEQEQDTVFHEVLHAVDYTMQAKLSERQVATMATGLLAVLKENPSLVEYLLDKSGL